MNKKYQMTLSIDYEGDVIVEANSKKEAEEKGELILRITAPYWMEVGGEEISNIRVFNEKKHVHEYSLGSGQCICGKINKKLKF